VLLVIITLIPYSRLFKCGFVNYDDPIYVTQNPHVQQLSVKNLLWAFNVGYNSNWHPLTWISHMMDYRLWGMNAVGHHATSLLLHLASVVLLFLILNRMTRTLWQSAFVAALFAIHPLHVESVAWIAERKDVLSTVFWMLTIGAYILYTEKPQAKKYWAMVTLYALGLMAKPMLVSLPLVLLMLDYWPLKRLKGFGMMRLIVEKAPLFVLAAASCVVTMIAQNRSNAASSLELLPLGMRVSNTVVSYIAYMEKMLWPQNLAVFYPHPYATLPIWKIVMSASVLMIVSMVAAREYKRRPYVAVGWLWYLVTLLPVIGLVQVGAQGMADRYTYIPLIGIFIMVAWSIRWGEGGMGKWGVKAAACLVIVGLQVMTWIQIGYWQNSIVLFTHALQIFPEHNYPAHCNLASALGADGQYEAAIVEYEKAVAIRQDEAPVYCGYGEALLALGRVEDAARRYQEALRIDPSFSIAVERLNAMERSLRETGAQQLHHSEKKPESNEAMGLINRAVVLESRGQTEKAIKECREALRIDPNSAIAHNNLGVIYDRHGRNEEAIREFREALRIQPDFARAHNSLAVALCREEDYTGALQEVELCRRYGGTPDLRLIQVLAGKTQDLGK
jgi:Flp pilus assembly protein TadD